MKQKQIKVLDHPPTYILVDADADEQEARKAWAKKHAIKKALSDEQVRREKYTVRLGKVSQRTRFKS